MRSVVTLLCILTLRLVASVPSTLQSSCSTELVRVKLGDTLHLPCGSHCPQGSEHTYTWWRVWDGGQRQQLSYTGVTVTEDAVTGESGGEYECRCGSSGQICTFYVAMLPEVTFTSSHTDTHYGDVVTLKCAIEGYPVNTSAVTNSNGIRLQTQIKKKISQFRMETIAVVQDVEEEEYVCLVETHYKGYRIAEEKQSLKINLYNPPSILYTTEYVIHQEEEFGKPGQLSCVVQTSSDAQSRVTWWADGEQLVEGGNYRMSSSAMSDEVTIFQLHMADVQQSDIGPFLCQLSSQYNVEESQDAWIKVDYRKDTGFGTGYTDNVALGDSPTHTLGMTSSSLHTVALFVCLVAVVGLGTWGVMAHRRKGKRLSVRDGILGRGEVSVTGSLLTAHSMGKRQSIFKRK